MEDHGHKPYYRGHECRCASCGAFLFDVRTGARLRNLTDVDEVRLAAVIHRFSNDPELARRLVSEDMREVVSTYKFADKLNDFLRNPKARPDLQTPEAQQFLNTLDTYHSPKTDPLMPWLTREWKKGRIKLGEGSEPGVLQADYGPEYEHERGSHHRLMPSELEHWADWYNSDHPSRKGNDIMQFKSPELHKVIKDWDTDMRDNAKDAAEIRGDVEHSYPDGWTVQRLTTPKQLEDEGEAMGHCVGSYADQVQRGNSLIYSLRDHHNKPHATWEVTPQEWEDEEGQRYDADQFNNDPSVNLTPLPHNGKMEQIQGKGNEPPIEDYQKRIKDYFEKKIPNQDERPRWDDQHYEDIHELMDPEGHLGYIAYHPGNYGLHTPKTTFDWPSLIESQHGWGEYEADDFVKKAVEHGEFPIMADYATKDREERQQERQEELISEWEKYAEEQFAQEYYQHDPEPHPEDERFNSSLDYNANGYNKAWEEWEKREQQAREEHLKSYLTERNNQGYQEGEYLDNMEVAIAVQKRKEQEGIEGTAPITAKLDNVRSSHNHFSTGESCYCTFRQPESFGWHEAVFMDDEANTCPTCGDPLDHGQCQRCDWGQWSNAMGPGDQIADPTKEFHPGIQASIPSPPQEQRPLDTPR